jgi:hypothetical protein
MVELKETIRKLEERAKVSEHDTCVPHS